MTGEPFLTMHKYHLSREKAREAVLATLAHSGSERPNIRDWRKTTIHFSVKGKTRTVSCADLEKEARETGVVEELQRLIDTRDSVFGGTFDSATPNYQMTVTTEYAGWKKEVQGPCRIGVATNDLMEDILHYRQETCRASSDYSFRLLSRHYRAYLAACVSIVDAFINRHILLASHDGFASDAFTRLKEARGMEEKIEHWLETCTEKTIKDLARRKEWCHFQELRQERNALEHAVDPFAVYDLKIIARYLNYVRSGIGELLRLLRQYHGKPSVMFIERLRTAPEVSYHQRRLEAATAPPKNAVEA
jgi:hypothetical protein